MKGEAGSRAAAEGGKEQDRSNGRQETWQEKVNAGSRTGEGGDRE